MEKESSENDISANGIVQETLPKEKEDKQEGQGFDLVEPIKEEPSDEKPYKDILESDISSKTENGEEKKEDSDPRDEGMETPSENDQEQKNDKESLPKMQSSTKPPSNVEKQGDCTLTTTKEKELANEKVVTATTTPQSSPATQPSANRNSVSAASTRSTRSQNPEFLARQRNFLQKVHLASSTKADDDMSVNEDENRVNQGSLLRTSAYAEDSDTANKRKRERSASNGAMSPVNVPGAASCTGNNSGGNSPALTQQQIKKRRTTRLDSPGAQMPPICTSPTEVMPITEDHFCWVCHKDYTAIHCVTCPRVYHLRCVQLETAPTVDWVCPECSTILQAENFDTRSKAMRLLSLEQLCTLLKFAVSRMKTVTGAEPFCKAVDLVEFKYYRNFVAHPMDLALLERNIKKRMYGSTEAFIADTKWIVHNCVIFNSYHSRLTGVAKQLVKVCRQEMSEIENCPDCYLYAHTRKDSWFIEVCRRPHILVWAKLKGFPFWPAKVMRTNKEGMVDVRFFGAHDRAWVPTRECFLYSKTMPGSARSKKRNNLEACIEEVEAHTKKLRDKFGAFEHAPLRTNFDPSIATEQLQILLPKYNPNDEVGPTSAKRARWSGGYASRRSQAIAQDSMKVEEQIAAAKAGNIMQEESEPLEQVASREVESSEEDSRQDLSQNLSQKRASRESSVCSEESQGSEAEAVLKDRKSASLIEWSRFEESAAKLTTGEDGDDEQEDDKQSDSFDNSKKDESSSSSSSVDLPQMKATEPSTSEKSEEERTAFELETSEVVKKVAEGLTKVAIADKLQEKLLQMEKHLQLEENENEDCETSAQDKKEEMSVHKTDNPINDNVKISAADSISSKQTEGETDPQESGEGEKATENGNIKVASPVSADTGTSETEESAKQVTPKVILFNVNRDEVPEDTDSMSSKKVDKSPSLASESAVDSEEGVENEECSKKNDNGSSDYNKKKTLESGINSMDRISETTETENHLASNETEMCLYPSKTERLSSSTENEQLTAHAEKELESINQPSVANTETEANSLQDSSKEREKESDTSVADSVAKPAEDVTEESIGLVLKKEREDVDDTAVDGEIDKEVADDDNTLSEKTVSNELPNNTGLTDENPNSGANVVTSAAATIAESNENEARESEENVALQQSAVLPSASEEKLEQTRGSTDSMSEKPSSEKEASSNSSILDKAIDEQTDASRATETTETHETDKGSTSQEVGAELERPIKEEPVDPDDDPTETPTPKTTEHTEDRPLTENRQCDSAAEKASVADKNINSGLEDKERQTSNASPTLSDKDGIFPSLFLDPSITITVVNDKQSEPSEVPTVSKTGNSPSTSEINVNNLRASVNLSKDISLTVVGADYGGHVSSGKEIMGLDMECDHASDHDSCDSPTNSSTAATSPLSLTVRNSPSSILGQNTAKKTKKKVSGPNDSLQARSRARKSFPNKPLPSVKVKSQPELMNGITGFGNKPNSLLRRNSITGADSRLSSCGPLPHPDIMPPQQHGNQIQGENSTTTADNSNSIIMAPPMLGNSLPQNSTNPLQALRAVNGNIGAPSTHLVNGNSEANISARIIGQQGTSGPRISPASGNNARMPPQLQPRPSGPLLSQHPPPVPSEAGQVTAELNRHSQKISDCVRAALHNILCDLSTLGNPQATIKTQQLEIERQQWLHKQEMAEMKHNTDLLVMEMRASMEAESQRIMTDTLQRCELEKQRAVEETKKKQWCTNCGKEALFYCCWNTSYCDYPCQQHHWPQHMSSCAQNQPVENREGGDMSQQNSPKQAGRGISQNKAAAQQQPWFDSSSLYNSATSSSGNTSPLNHQRNNSLSPLSSSSLVIDEDYDNNNNSNNFETLSQERANVTKKRKRCGECAGCTRVGKCGVCPPCKSVRTHQVCRQRRCSNLLEEGMVRRTGLAQQKQSGKFIGGPPLSYSGPSGPTQMPPQRGRMPNPSQYLGPRGGNMQVSGYSKSATQVTSTASASLTTSTTESAFPTYICNVPRRPTWSRTGSNAASSPEANGISVPTPSSSTTTSYGIQHSSASLLHMSK